MRRNNASRNLRFGPPSGQSGRPARTFGAKRWCEDCGCRLSVYNPDSRCDQCAQKKGRRNPIGKGGVDFPGRVTNTTRARKSQTGENG